MTINEIISEKRKQRGIPVSELSRRTGIKYEALRVALEGRRNITANEMLILCDELDLTLEDFESVCNTVA